MSASSRGTWNIRTDCREVVPVLIVVDDTDDNVEIKEDIELIED